MPEREQPGEMHRSPSRRLENLLVVFIVIVVLGLLIFTAAGNRPFIYAGF